MIYLKNISDRDLNLMHSLYLIYITYTFFLFHL